MTTRSQSSELSDAFYSLDQYEIVPGSGKSASIYAEQSNYPSTFSDSGYIQISRNGTYQFLVESDDGGSASIGAAGSVGTMTDHSMTGECGSFYLKAGFYRVSLTHNDIGAKLLPDGSYTKNSNAFFFKWDNGKGGSPGGNYVPGKTPESTPSSWETVTYYDIRKRTSTSLAPNPDTLYTNPLESEAGQSQAGVVTIYGEPGAGCTLQSSNPTALILGDITAGNSSSEYGHASMTAGTIPGDESEEGKVDVTVTLKSSSGATLATCDVTVLRNKCKPEDECSCTACGDGTSTGAKCISFGIAFGRSQHLAGAPTGQLKIEEDKPSARIYTSAILHFNHPMMRKISYISADKRFINVINEIGDIVSYKDGVRYGNSSGIQSEIAILKNADEEIIGYRETLSDRTTVYYDATGNFDHLVTSENLLVSTANIGIDPILDSNGNIRQIWAASEGLLDVTTGTDSFVISWYKNANVTGKDSATNLYTFSGSPIKTFTFEKPSGTTGNNALHLTERRGTSFEFHYDWTYVTANSDWTIRKGSDTVFSLEAKARSAAQNGNIILSYTTSGSDGGTQTTTEELSTTAQGNRIVGRTINGIAQMNGARDSSDKAGGRLGSSTNRSGNTTSYEYDDAGRTTKITRTGFGGFQQITQYEYGANVNDHLDTRPTKVTEQLKNSATGITTTLSETIYEYQDDTSIGRTETITQTVKGVAQITKRCWWPVSNTVESGRLMSELRPDGTMTLYEYSATSIEALDITNYSNYTYTESITEGIKSNIAADHYFGVAANRSNRKINTYDAAGNIIRTENYIHCNNAFRLISWEEHTYNSMHKVIASLYSDGKTSSADWICTGPVFEVDTDGIRTDYNYDALKRCTSKVRHSPNGDITTSYTYDAEGRVLSTTVSGGSGNNFVSETTSQTYDLEGRIATQTDGRGLVTSFSYSADNLTTTETRPNGGTVITTRNLDGTTASVTGTAVTPVFYSYYLEEEEGLEVTEERYGSTTSKRWRKTYTNKFGQTVKIQESAWNESVKTTVNTYNAQGQLVSTASTNAPTVTYLYDNMGNISQETISDGETKRILTHAYQHVGYASTEWAMRQLNSSKCSDTTIPANSTYLFTQLSGFSNTLEQKTESKNVRGLSTLDWSSFDPATKVRSVRHTEPGANTGTTTLIRDGLTLSETDAAGGSTTYTYDALGRQLTATDGRGNTTTNVYNNKGELVSTTDAANHTTTYTYSATTGELVTVTDANGKTVNYVYDLKGQKIAEYGTATYPVSFEYNAFGEMIKLFTYRNPNAVIVTNPDPADGDQTTWIYDESSGLLASKTYADNKTVTYTYDVKGQLLTRTWARTNGVAPLVTSYAYNIYGELLTVIYSDGTTPNVTNTYNAMGMLISSTDVGGTSVFAYTNYRELTSETNSVFANGFVFSRMYDNFGRVTAYIIDGTTLATYSYLNTNNRLNKVNNNITFGYVSIANLLGSITRPSGANTTWHYEAQRNLVSSVELKKSNSTLSNYAYTNDELGRRMSMSRTGSVFASSDTLSYAYNDRSEVVGATSNQIESYNYAYSFDNIGNRINSTEETAQKTYTSNQLNQYTSLTNPVETPTYDDDGNMLTNGAWAYVWDMENRLVAAENDTVRLEFTYDRMSRRIEKKVYQNNILATHLKFIYNEFKLIEERDALNENAPLRRYTWQSVGLDAPLYVDDVQSNMRYYYHTDANKNVTELTDASGAVVAHYEYSPFGGVVTATGAYAEDNPFRFSSEYSDTETGLVYYNYRYYSPELGRWLSRDPIVEQGGWNLYSMVNNNNISNIDNRGLELTVASFAICFTKCNIVSTIGAWYKKTFTDGMITGNFKRTCEIELKLPTPSMLVDQKIYEYSPTSTAINCLKDCIITIPGASSLVGIEYETKITSASYVKCDNDKKKVNYFVGVETNFYATVNNKKMLIYHNSISTQRNAGEIAWCRCCQ